MISSEIFIIKRDGKREVFSLDKIKNAIAKAFLSVGSFATQDVITNVLSRVSISDGTNVEEIQNQVEVALMAEHYYSVAKAYMLYRQKHLEDREVRDKLKFLMDYCDASNPASGSKYDANANVENKNIATLIGELPKSNFIRLNRRLLTDRLRDMYGKEASDRYLELLNHHFIYKNDETNLANYCASITMYPWLIAGTTAVGGNSTAKYFVSANRKLVAYPNNAEDEQVTAITIQNFETGETYEKTCASGDLLLALGFVENDLIYGCAHSADVIMTSDGQAILPLYELYIMSDNGEQKKDYTKDGIYIMNASVGEDTIYLTRARKQNQFFEEIDQDYISYKKEENNKMITTDTTYDSYAWNILDIVFPSNFYLSDTASYRKTKYGSTDAYKDMQVQTKTRDGAYYVFDNAGYIGEYETAGSAITRVVDDEAGLVVDSNGNTIYRCLAADSYNTVADEIKETPNPDANQSLLTCAYMCAQYAGGTLELTDAINCGTFEKVFEDYTNGVGINISGISLSTALYFLDRDIPFAACIDDGRYVLVISYNSTHIRYYDPVLGAEVKVTRKAFENSLSLQSNTMYTFSVQ